MDVGPTTCDTQTMGDSAARHERSSRTFQHQTIAQDDANSSLPVWWSAAPLNGCLVRPPSLSQDYLVSGCSSQAHARPGQPERLKCGEVKGWEHSRKHPCFLSSRRGIARCRTGSKRGAGGNGVLHPDQSGVLARAWAFWHMLGRRSPSSVCCLSLKS